MICFNNFKYGLNILLKTLEISLNLTNDIIVVQSIRLSIPVTSQNTISQNALNLIIKTKNYLFFRFETHLEFTYERKILEMYGFVIYSAFLLLNGFSRQCLSADTSDTRKFIIKDKASDVCPTHINFNGNSIFASFNVIISNAALSRIQKEPRDDPTRS